MHIIPVIDVRHGIAVHARAGDRTNYQPLESPLATSDDGQPSSDPLSIAAGYRALYPFMTLYIADLDAIEGRKPNAAIAASLASAQPGFDVWLDAGRSFPGVVAIATRVIGSETISDGEAAAQMTDEAVLSLDFRGDTFLGPARLLASPALWPSRIIVMTLGRVGTQLGPDLDRIAEIARVAPRAKIYAAGGIRDAADLRAARVAGAHGALIASALHAQKIRANDLREIIGP